MKLTASPFDPQSGDLLPVYRDAYLRGDLALASSLAVEHYLGRDATQAHATLTRWHQLGDGDEANATPGWVGRQLRFIQEQPQRIRQRALPLLVMGALLAGASLAANHRPATVLPITKLAAASTLTSLPVLEAAAPAAMVLVEGRILDEKGQALAGATVLQKGTRRAVSTNAAGEYSLQVPASEVATLQFGYAGYQEQELPLTAGSAVVTLQPNATKHHRWLFF